MRWSQLLFALAILGVSGPALAEQGKDAPGVTVLRGASAPPAVTSSFVISIDPSALDILRKAEP